jgi:hypothetical protein
MAVLSEEGVGGLGVEEVEEVGRFATGTGMLRMRLRIRGSGLVAGRP